MDANYLSLPINNTALLGPMMTTENAVVLQSSLVILKTDEALTNIHFWGKIYADLTDYFIVYGSSDDVLDTHKFYYSIDCVEWFRMPTTDDKKKYKALQCTNCFIGDPSQTSELPDSGPISDEQGYYDVERRMVEEDRLAAIVDLITEESAILPRGALYKRADELITYNKVFQGLTEDEAGRLYNYVHFRKPQEIWNTKLLTKKDNNFALDFLDSIDRDSPEAAWALQFDRILNSVLIHNLYWPGMTFYHHIQTPFYGYLYTGNGRKNMDLPFMTAAENVPSQPY